MTVAAVAAVIVVLGTALATGPLSIGGEEGEGKNFEVARGAKDPWARSLPHAFWMISGIDLELLRQNNAGVARRFFNSGQTFVIGTPEHQDLVPRGYRSLPAVMYTSVKKLEDQVHAGLLDPEVGAVIYDPEAWTKTPAAEQEHPVAAMKRFVRVARQAGYAPILVPGRDLALRGMSCSKQSGETLDAAYLRCRLTDGSRGAEQFVIQAAPIESEPRRLNDFLAAARTQLRTEAPRVTSIASLSTDPPGAAEPIWPVDLVKAAKIALRHSSGILFNFTPSTIEVAASFLRDLERDSPVAGKLVYRRD